MILSILLAGLGHVYVGRFGRALIWFGGLLVLGLIVDQEGAEPWIILAVGGPLSLFAALDVWLIIRGEGRRR